MAKLSAHGRELFRVRAEKETPKDEFGSATRYEYAVMSDRAILKKVCWKRRPSKYDPKARWDSGGWKLFGKLKKETEPKWYAESLVKEYRAKGYTVTVTN